MHQSCYVAGWSLVLLECCLWRSLSTGVAQVFFLTHFTMTCNIVLDVLTDSIALHPCRLSSLSNVSDLKSVLASFSAKRVALVL